MVPSGATAGQVSLVAEVTSDQLFVRRSSARQQSMQRMTGNIKSTALNRLARLHHVCNARATGLTGAPQAADSVSKGILPCFDQISASFVTAGPMPSRTGF